jgi:signal transduction histidine kinase
MIHTDPVRLVQILITLLDTAAQYTPDRGEIQLTAARHDATVHLSARDGMGLRLVLTKRLVTLHGETIHASTDGRGKGSAFLIRLPVHGQAGEGVSAVAGYRPTTPAFGPPSTCSGRPDTSVAPYCCSSAPGDDRRSA